MMIYIVDIWGIYNEMIDKGRCQVQQGDVSHLTLPEEKYDLATAFETIYFWPGFEKCFLKVRTDHHDSKPWITVMAEK